MTVKECYEKMGGNYEQIMERLAAETIVEKFMYKFLDDKSMEKLVTAIDANDAEGAFQAAHMLKGVAGNLSFDKLQKSSSELTEYLRPKTGKIDLDLYNRVKADYQLIIDSIEEYRR